MTDNANYYTVEPPDGWSIYNSLMYVCIDRQIDRCLKVPAETLLDVYHTNTQIQLLILIKGAMRKFFSKLNQLYVYNLLVNDC